MQLTANYESILADRDIDAVVLGTGLFALAFFSDKSGHEALVKTILKD